MKLSVVTACVGRNDVNRRWLDTTLAACTTKPELTIVTNGSTQEEVDELQGWLPEWVEGIAIGSLPEPVGSTRAFAIGVGASHGDVVAAIQNDVLIHEQGWDQKLLDFFAEHEDAGVVGFAGAKGLGAAHINYAPYHFSQLGRWNVYSSLVDWQHHGAEATQPVRVVVLDGIALCFRRTAFHDWGGYDLGFFHHMYDNDLSLSAHFSGRQNYVLPVRCEHLNGQTANCSERYARVAEPMGGDIGVHQAGHLYFYNKWRHRLPIAVP